MKLNDLPSVDQIWEEKNKPNNKVTIYKIDRTHVYFKFVDSKDQGLLGLKNFMRIYKKTQLN